ncbi:hypothetical protein [Amycolatopsis sp. NBC_01286]|uniref:hypothetical protein n=1 Tax=Amycolatopsis sp. NBC_01286 TaxID=2903560 RepID=UPI002E0DDC7B|nr:hypothetical protein OG570_21805 [Amycolatopsis sp. NBC_01286]
MITTEPSDGDPERDRTTDARANERPADVAHRALVRQIAVSTAESVARPCIASVPTGRDVPVDLTTREPRRRGSSVSTRGVRRGRSTNLAT